MDFDQSDDLMWNRRVELLNQLRNKYPKLQVPGDQNHLGWFQHDEHVTHFINELNYLDLDGVDNVTRDNLIRVIADENNITPAQRTLAIKLAQKAGVEVPKTFTTSAADVVTKEATDMWRNIPRGSGLLETNTSIDSETLKAFYGARYGGTGPGTARIHVTN